MTKAAATKSAASPAQQLLLQRLIQLGVLSAGVGAGAGAIKAVSELHNTPNFELGSGSNVPSTLPITLGKPAKPDKSELKVAGAVGDTVASMLPEPDNTNVLTGRSIPLTAAAATLPAMAVYSLSRQIANSIKNRDRVKQLDSAKQDYNSALAAQYRNLVMGKAANEEEQAVLDGISELCKTADESKLNRIMSMLPFFNPLNVYGSAAVAMSRGALGNNATEGFNSLKGLGTLAMLSAGLGGASYMYGKSRQVDPEVVTRQALKQRAKARRAVPNTLIPILNSRPGVNQM